MTAPGQVTDSQALLLQLLDPANRAAPYPLYGQIREHGALQLPENNLTVFTSFAECDAVLRHSDSCCDRAKSIISRRFRESDEAPRINSATSFLFLDAPDHTRLRGLVSKAFVPKVINALEPEIRALVDRLLDGAQGDEFDVISELAYPLPVAVICRLLGVPVTDEPQFRDASALLAQALDPFLAMTGEASGLFDKQMAAGEWLGGYLRDLIAQRRRTPGDDLMSALIQVEESGDQLTEDEIVATCDLLLIAGHETTVNLIANATLAMLRDPQQWRALASDAERVSSVIEETMRYDPPVQLVSRIAGADMTIGHIHVPEGDTMLLLLAAAHRDPAVFERPDAFDPDRGAFRHLGFGKGVHFCLGAPLARLEASVALSALTARFPDARLAAEPVYKPNLTLRGMSTLRLSAEQT